MAALSPQTLDERKREAFRVASEMYRHEPDWLTFFREILGVDGVVRSLFRSEEAMASFEKTEEYRSIQDMLERLRQNSRARAAEKEPTRVITVRLPKSVHELLRAEAHEKKMSMNKLCISKLLRVVAQDPDQLT